VTVEKTPALTEHPHHHLRRGVERHRELRKVAEDAARQAAASTPATPAPARATA